MKHIKLMILAFAIIFFTACGSDSSTNPTAELTAETTSLQDELKGEEFFVILDNIQTKSMFKISLDENLSSWEIKIYAGDYSLEPANEFNNTIAVTDDTLTESGGSVYKLQDSNGEYINLVSTTSDLVSLKMFDTADEAQLYYNISLSEKLKGKEFFVVQNDLAKRSLYKISIDENATQWDITTYDSAYNEENISNTSAGMTIDVGDSNLTDSGGASFWLSVVEDDSFKLVAYGNSLVTLDFYETAEDALAYYNSTDLRTELSAKTFYTVSNNSQEKQLIQFTFDESLTQWAFELYAEDYNETATTAGSNTIQVTEDKIYETDGDTLKIISKNSDYIELQSVTNASSLYRLYNTTEAAKTYYSE